MHDQLNDAFERLCHTWREIADQWDDAQYQRMATEYMTPLIEQTQRYLDVLASLHHVVQREQQDD